MANKKLYGRDFLTLLHFSSDEICYLLHLAAKLKRKKRAGRCSGRLKGKNIALLFEKDSTRTRCAFEVAAYDEGACVTYLTNSHFGRKESISDTAKVLSRYYHGIQFRGFLHSTVEALADAASVPVWNGLTDCYHPTQALADLLTIKEQLTKPFKQLKLVYVGDTCNNVATSLMIAAAKMGMSFVGLGPQALFPETSLIAKVKKLASATGAVITFTSDIETAVRGADVIYTDVWLSMGARDDIAQRVQLLSPYQVNTRLLAATQRNNVIFMHCLPACHDTGTELGAKVFAEHGLSAMEVTDEVFSGAHSVVFEQAENRLHTIKAIMLATIGNVRPFLR